MKYLIIGTGGTGAAIGAFLANDGRDVTFVARGEQLRAIEKNGLMLKSGIKGEIKLSNVKVSEGGGPEKYDVIFVCVKSYSLEEIIPIIAAASDENTVVIPILNMFKTGARLKKSLPEVKFLEGCIYISAFIEKPGVVVQAGNVFKLFFGNPYNEDTKVLGQIESDLKSAGITASVSEDILQTSFKKFSFISAFAATGAFYDIDAGAIHKEGEIREFYKSLVREIIAAGKAMQVNISPTLFEEDIESIDAFGDDIKTSLQRDLESGKRSEIDTLIFDVAKLGQKYGIPMPCYEKVTEKFNG